MIERRHILFLKLAALTFLLAACAAPRADFYANAGDDVTLRHPIELRKGWQELDIVAAPVLDARAKAQIAEFASEHARFGQGPVFIRMPSGLPEEALLRGQMDRVRAALVSAGMRGSVKLIREPVGATQKIPALTLSFARMKAETVTRCGRWPEDLASGSTINGWENQPWHNFGCAHQSMLATQAADPRDLVAPRAQAPADAQMRVRAIEALQDGKDPAIGWNARTNASTTPGTMTRGD